MRLLILASLVLLAGCSSAERHASASVDAQVIAAETSVRIAQADAEGNKKLAAELRDKLAGEQAKAKAEREASDQAAKQATENRERFLLFVLAVASVVLGALAVYEASHFPLIADNVRHAGEAIVGLGAIFGACSWFIGREWVLLVAIVGAGIVALAYAALRRHIAKHGADLTHTVYSVALAVESKAVALGSLVSSRAERVIQWGHDHFTQHDHPTSGA